MTCAKRYHPTKYWVWLSYASLITIDNMFELFMICLILSVNATRTFALLSKLSVKWLVKLTVSRIRRSNINSGCLLIKALILAGELLRLIRRHTRHYQRAFQRRPIACSHMHFMLLIFLIKVSQTYHSEQECRFGCIVGSILDKTLTFIFVQPSYVPLLAFDCYFAFKNLKKLVEIL